MLKNGSKKVKELLIYSDGGVINNGKKDKTKSVYGSYCSLIVLPKKKTIQKIFNKVEGDVTNNIMELKGAIVAMNYIVSKIATKHPEYSLHVTVISDSQYLIKGCSEWMYNWKKNGWKDSSKKPIKNKELWLQLIKLIKNEVDVTFEFKWVRGHKGKSVSIEEDSDSYFNEKCDTILSEALEPYRKL